MVWSFEEQPCHTLLGCLPLGSLLSHENVWAKAQRRAYSRRFIDRQGLVIHPTSVHDADAVFLLVKEAIEMQNNTKCFTKPNNGFYAVMFLTQVPHMYTL